MNIRSVSVVGLGYIGLPTAVLIASSGFEVNGFDINIKVVKNINGLNIPENEPKLKELTKQVLDSGHLKVSTILVPSDIYVICVPTPLKKGSNEILPDTDHVFEAIEHIKKYLNPNNSIIIESTCPPGTTLEVSKKIGLEKYINIAYCPERILPGNLIQELIHNDRIIGGINNKSSNIIGGFYSKFCKGKINYCTSLTAEIVKLAENSYRDINIAYANSLSLIADKLNISVKEIIELANKHPRVNILKPGIGVGGHCIPVDPWFLINSFPDETKLLSEARNINDYKPFFIYEKIQSEILEYEKIYKKQPSILCLGLSYKENSVMHFGIIHTFLAVFVFFHLSHYGLQQRGVLNMGVSRKKHSRSNRKAPEHSN